MNKGAPESSKPGRRRRKKGKIIQVLEYGAILLLLPVARRVPIRGIHLLSSLLGNLLFLFLADRRKIAIENIRNALGIGKKSEEEIARIARASCKSFFLTCFETVKFQPFFKAEDVREVLMRSSETLEALFQKAKRIHEESGGCIFVTPHIGNWEFLPDVSSIVGIPLVVVARRMQNAYLEKLIYSRRADSGQVIIPKRNALFALQKTLQQGKSIGLLPDQSTQQGILVNFFGRKASTTPVPAILAILYHRPIVVVACCRKRNGYDFEGVVSDPLWPGKLKSEKEEIFRLTEEMNKKMEAIICQYPEQYFWIHNRWKTYRSNRRLLQ